VPRVELVDVEGCNLVRDRRRALGLSAAEVAQETGAHITAVHRWERRERLPGPWRMQLLAHALVLLTGEDAAFFDTTRQSRWVAPVGARMPTFGPCDVVWVAQCLTSPKRLYRLPKGTPLATTPDGAL
jgi:transcriptional regulator with XRE-family HTH domain